MLSIRLPENLERRLTLLASITNKPKSFYVRQALENSLQSLEDKYLKEYGQRYLPVERNELSKEEIRHLLRA